MDGHNSADIVEEGVRLKDGMQQDREYAGLPVVAVDHIGMEPDHRQDRKRCL